MHFAILVSLLLSVSDGPVDPCSQIEPNTIVSTIEFDGLDHTLPSVVQRYLRHQPGVVFQCDEWAIEKTALENLDIFATVNLESTTTPAGVQLTYTFKELPQMFVFPAMKATDQQGWAGGGGISMLNLLGRDIRLDFYVRATLYPDPLSALEYMLYADSPTMGDIPLKWELTVVHNDSENPLVQFEESSFLADIKLYQKLSGWPLQILYLGHIFSVTHDPNVEFFEPSDGRNFPLFLSDTGRDWVPKLGLGLVVDTREKIYNPHFGFYGEFSGSQFGGFLGGPADYLEILGDVRGFVPAFGRDVLVLAGLGRYRPGTMGAYDFLHVGGANTLRTHGINPDFYGQHEIISTTEYRMEFFEREPFEVFGSNLYFGFQWVLGADAVFQWRKAQGRPVMLTSIYTGPHILFPGFDRIRIEIGINNLEQGLDKLAYGISIGLFEKLIMQRQRVR